MAPTNTTVTTGISFIDKLFSGVLTEVVIAIVIVLVGFIIGKILGRLLKKMLNEFKVDEALKKSIGLKWSLENSLSSFLTYVIYFIAIVTALNQIGLTTAILNMISGAVILLIVISIFLALKDAVPNFFAGIKISQNEMVKKGDTISFDKITARVVEVTPTETKLESKSGDIIFIPNSLLIKKIVKVPKRKIIKSQVKK